MEALFIVLIVFLGIGLTLFIVFNALRKVANQREAAARERFPDAVRVIRGANFFGQESKGVGQLRGNGTLVITPNEVFFELWVTKRELLISLATIQGIETPKSHLGKTYGTSLLKVVYTNEQGQPDSAAWAVANLTEVKDVLQHALERRA